MKNRFLALLFTCGLSTASWAQMQNNPESNHGNKFEQLGTIIQDPNMYRSASGAPGPRYWQQRADYDIDVELDDQKQRITGSETVTYYNNSPDPLSYIWLQLDENEHNPKSDNQKFEESSMKEKMSIADVKAIMGHNQDLGVKIEKLTDGSGKALKYTINQTMLRMDLPKTLKPGERLKFNVNWNYNN